MLPGEIDALFTDVRTIEGHLTGRPLPCRSLKLKITSVAGATLPLGTASTRSALTHADLLFARINDLVADGTLANLASIYALAAPESNLELAQRVQNRRRHLRREASCLGLGCLLVLFAVIGVRMRAVQRAAEETRLNLEESDQRFHAFMDHLAKRTRS